MENEILRWIKKGEFVPTYYCPKCKKEALNEVIYIDNFKTVQSPFCPFCGVRLQKAINGEEDNENG